MDPPVLARTFSKNNFKAINIGCIYGYGLYVSIQLHSGPDGICALRPNYPHDLIGPISAAGFQKAGPT
jgi:hypothetical protein